MGWAILIVVVAALCRPAYSDGKFFVHENVPADVPYQRAILLFHEGRETLILQSRYDLGASPASSHLGWVIPAPTVPEIASAEPSLAKNCFFQAAWQTRPNPLRISSLFFLGSLIVFLGGFAVLLICLAQYPFARKSPVLKVAWNRRARNSTRATLLAFLVLMTTMPVSLSRSRGGVEVIKAEQVGIYDTKVVRGEDPEAITEWLTENGLGFGDKDARALQAYVDRGWCFVAARVRPTSGTEEEQIVADGLVAPLILEFRSEKPVYPLALTATVGTETEVLIYSLTDRKLTCGDRLKLLCATASRAPNLLRPLAVMAQVEAWPVLNHVPETPMMLCKFKGRLTPAQMQDDLVFDFASDNQPYRQDRIVW